MFAAAGCRPRLLVAIRTMLRLLGLVDPFMRELVEMHYLLTTPVILDDAALRGLLGGVRKTSCEEGIRRTLAAMRAERRAAS